MAKLKSNHERNMAVGLREHPQAHGTGNSPTVKTKVQDAERFGALWVRHMAYFGYKRQYLWVRDVLRMGLLAMWEGRFVPANDLDMARKDRDELLVLLSDDVKKESAT